MHSDMTERGRIVRTLRGEHTDLFPWATRLDIWYTSRTRTGTLPAEMAGLDLMDIHRALGLGRQRYASLITSRLHGVEMAVEFNGDLIAREFEPRVSFPNPLTWAVADRPGTTVITFKTPAGAARVVYATNEDLVRGAAVPYLMKHILEDDHDFDVVQWILTHIVNLHTKVYHPLTATVYHSSAHSGHAVTTSRFVER
mgnify:CR=1 FL=1